MPADDDGPPKGISEKVITMSYIRNPQSREGRNPRTPGVLGALGDLASTITNIASTVGIATELATDPYLPEVVCRVGQVKAINDGKSPSSCVRTAPNLSGGVGLRKAVKPMRAYVYAEQHKWVYPAAVIGVLAIPFLIGYAAGKGSK